MAGLSIAHVTNSFRSDGTGITNVAADLAVSQADRGHRVAVVCDGADETMRRLAAEHGVRLRERAGSRTPLQLWRSAQALAPLLSSADVIHVHTVRAALLALLAAPWRFFTRSVATVHNPYQRSTVAMLAARTVVAISGVDARAVRKRSLGLRRAVVITNGVLASPRVPALGGVHPAPLQPDSLVFVGALSERKGLDVLLEAMHRVVEAVPTARLFVVGNRDNPDLEERAAGLGAAVSFEGFSPDPRRYLLPATAFVLPSRAEGFPLALLEALGCGVPVVASRAGGIPEAVGHGTAASLVDPGDVEGLAAALIEVLHDGTLRARLRDAGAALAATYTVDRMTDDYLRTYRAAARR